MVTDSAKERKVSSLHILVVGLSLAMTIGAWLYSKHQVDLQVRTRFEDARNRTIGLIEDRMSRYEDALWSGVAYADAMSGRVTATDWKAFANSLNIEEKYPGVNGIGLIRYVNRSDLQDYMSERDSEGRDFSIYPEHDLDFLLPITFIEPESVNAAAVGLDVAHETNRRTGLLSSRDSGKARITAPIFLVQDDGHTPGFLFYTPFYSGDAPKTVAERRERFEGVIYAPFVVRKLVEGLLSKELREVRFSLRDGDQLIYDEGETEEALNDVSPMFKDTVKLDMYGRVWTVDIWTNLAFRKQNSSEQPTLILAGGLIIEILVISMLAMLSRSNRQAHRYAAKLTQELRAKTENLEKANAEIEQFVYVASHDLKTPVRGIGFLADVIEEDLEEIIGPIEAHKELKMQLNMIRDRVRRMNDLTGGIMEFSRVGHYGSDAEAALPVSILIEDCVADFEVDPSQVRFSTDVEAISCDSHNFRRVVENLIGNAFKYHPNPVDARVEVSIEDAGDRLRVSVKDDGRGIAPDFHEKIFDVFQTLRKGTDPESTGIGLAIVKKAIQRHGFEICVKSSEGNGAEFTFCWPKERYQYNTSLEDVA
ncbi:CHASE domain-containing protein [Phaeobacter sp. HF9A]|uniref:CHASE domain-containing sensor histidine kinase n=1 Tax=Phaeobacter sp. HF9A TaxID=2721561 RepID=UPI00142F6029|nr:CHASE domain-containing protein [Phaeobacter sp. HF9A]NIZ13943.1 histidine kinase [Phaeobacter sp. HF9A]